MLKTTDLKEACVLQASSLLGRLLLYETLKCSLFGHWPSPRRVGGHKKVAKKEDNQSKLHCCRMKNDFVVFAFHFWLSFSRKVHGRDIR